MDQSKRVSTFFSLNCAISRVLRVTRDPQSIRNAVTIIGFVHVVRAAAFLNDWTLALQGLILSILCRVVPKTHASRPLCVFLISARIVISLLIALWLNHEDNLQTLIQQHFHIYVPAALIAAVLAGCLLGIEEAAEKYQGKYEPQLWFTDSAFVEEEMGKFSFCNLQTGWVTIELTAVPSTERARFVAELRNSNNNRIRKIKRHGPLATCEIRLPKGRYHVLVQNLRPYGPPLKVYCRVWVEERILHGGQQTKTPEPLDTSSLQAPSRQIHETPQTLQNQLCPTTARATRSPADDPLTAEPANGENADHPPDASVEYCFTRGPVFSDWEIRIEKVQSSLPEIENSDLPENAKRRDSLRNRNKPKGSTGS